MERIKEKRVKAAVRLGTLYRSEGTTKWIMRWERMDIKSDQSK